MSLKVNALTSMGFFWLSSSLAITVLANIFKSNGPDYEGGWAYILFSMLYFLLSFIFRKQINTKGQSLGISVFVLGVVTILFGPPLFENDHYRYLWEGKVLFSGKWPYLYPPNSPFLSHIEFEYKDNIGFPHLSSIYPPVALVWFGLGGLLPFHLGLGLLACLNGVLVWFLIQKLLRFNVKPYFLVLCFPLLQKEFIQSIHIDLLAFIFFFFILIGRVNLKGSKHKFLQLLWVFFTIWTKVIGGLGIILLAFKKRKDWGFLFALLLLGLTLPLSYYFLVPQNQVHSGVTAFSNYWIWNPGFYGILFQGFELGHELSRKVTFSCFGFYGLLVTLKTWRASLKGGPNQILLMDYSYLIFAGLMFFTPVYNPWYVIWFLVPALLRNCPFGVLYGVFSCWSYLYYGNPELLILGEFLSHIWFPLSLWHMFKRSKILGEENSPEGKMISSPS